MNKDRVFYLFEDVDEKSVKGIIEAIININIDDNEKDLKEKDFIRKPFSLIINSDEGSIYDGLGLISVIEQSKTPIHTYVFGKAFSMGLILSICGHRRYASKFASFMYHEGMGGARGTFGYIRNKADEYERVQDIIEEIILSKTKIKESQLKEVKEKQRDWFISSDEALKLGMVDEII